MTKKQFLSFVKSHLAQHNMQIIIGKGAEVKCDGLGVGGYFDESDGILKVAGKNIHWFDILIHEYCHFIQWLEKAECLKTFDKDAGSWDIWLRKKVELSEKKLDKAFKAARNVELDCEKRVIKMAKKYNLPLNVKYYIKGANAYMYLHSFVKKNRIWPSKSLSVSKGLFKLMPTKFLTEEQYNQLPQKIEYFIQKDCV